MEVKQQLWSVKLKPNTKTNVADLLPADNRNWTKFEIKQLALPHALSSTGVNRTTISVSEPNQDEPIVLCTLVPFMIERQPFDFKIRFDGKTKWYFEVEGPNPVNVSGLLFWASPVSSKSLNVNTTSMSAQTLPSASIDPRCIKEENRRDPKVSPPSSPLNTSSLAVSRGPIGSREPTNLNTEMNRRGPSLFSARDPRVSRPLSPPNVNFRRAASTGPFESREYRPAVTPTRPRSTSKHSCTRPRSPPFLFQSFSGRHANDGEFVAPPTKRRRYEDYRRDEYDH